MVLTLSKKEHKPCPAWHKFVGSMRDYSFEERCGFLNPDNAPGNSEMERRCNRSAALKWYWTKSEPSFMVWCVLNEMATHPDSIATQEQMYEQKQRVKMYEDAETRMKTRRRWRDRSLYKHRRNARRYWKKLRNYVKIFILIHCFLRFLRDACAIKRFGDDAANGSCDGITSLYLQWRLLRVCHV